jgi:hypothetical protein
VEPHGVIRAWDLIGYIIKSQIAPVLKSQGFRKEKRLWTRPAGETVQLVGLQASQWSVEDKGDFTFNLGVHWSTPYDDLICAPWPRSANAGFCVFCRRIGSLLRPPGDRWWDVSRSSKLDEVGQTAVQSVIEFGLPELDRFNSRSAIHEYLLRPKAQDRSVHNVMRLMVMQAQLGLQDEFTDVWRTTQTERWALARGPREDADRLAHQLASDYKLQLDHLG